MIFLAARKIFQSVFVLNGDDDAPGGILEQAVERLADLLFAHRVARALDVGGIGQQRQHTPAPPRGERIEVGHLAVNGRVVDLEVARHDDRARRAGDGQRHRPRNGVAHLDELHLERADAHRLPGLHDVELDAGDIMLRELASYEGAGELRAVDRRRHTPEHIGNRADMILMPMRNQIGAQALAVVGQVGDVRDDQVNAQHVLTWEDGAAVHHDDIVFIFKRRHVLANLAQTAQRNDSQLPHWFSPPFASSARYTQLL